MPDAIPFDRLQARLLPVADLVMVLMASRPASGTLRDTRVTIVTIYLAVATAVLATALAVLGLALAGGAHQLRWLLAVVVLLALAGGCADLATFGIRQRMLLRRAAS